MRPSSRIRHRISLTATLVFALTATAVAIPALADPLEVPGTDQEVCEINDILVNSCRPWLGARASGYPEAGSSLVEQHEYHEQRIKRPLDIVHTFAKPGTLPLKNSDERAMATRDDTYLFQNWKPSSNWKSAAGDDADINAWIDRAAENIKQIAPKQIFLTIHHEPENDVRSDPECVTKDSATAGTTEDYRNMWHNVRKRFDAQGVDNVVWVMDYMNYEKWECLVPELYPGDEYVDWIMFNAYGNGRSDDFADNVADFYNLLTELSTPERNLLSKPWGIVEWGISDSSQRQAKSYYDQAARTLTEDMFPKLRAYMIFDSPGTHDQRGLRVGYADNGRAASGEQRHYTEFANHPVFGD